MNAPIPPSKPTNGRPGVPSAPSPAPAFKLNVTRGVVAEPPRIVVYGDGGIGKSSLAMGAPSPLFLDLERGTLQLDLERETGIKTWDQLLSCVQSLATAEHHYKTLVIDTLDTAESLCWEHLCRKGRVDSIERYEKGFGKGYTAAFEEFRKLNHALDHLRAARGMGVIVISHAKVEKAPNTLGDEYERWTLKVHKQVAGLFFVSFDAVLYAHLETFTQKSDSGRVKGFGDRHVLETQASPWWLAKNRYRLPKTIDLSWDVLSAGIARGAEEIVASMREEIEGALSRLEELDAEAATKARETYEKTAQAPAALSVLLNRINAGVATREAARASGADDTSNTTDTANA